MIPSRLMTQTIAKTRVIAASLLFASPVIAQDVEEDVKPTFNDVTGGIQKQLQESTEALAGLRDLIRDEKVELTRELNALEKELLDVRDEFNKTDRLLTSRKLDIGDFTRKIKKREDEASYLTNLFTDYINEFQTRIHIAESARYEEPIADAKNAPENANLTESEVYAAQAKILDMSFDRVEDILGGTRFEGRAIDSTGLLTEGMFMLVGPAALFRSADGQEVGTVALQVNSTQPSVLSFANPEDKTKASELVATGGGTFPLDPTLGNAHKVEATNDTFIEHVKKGGEVMIPIFVLAGLALLIAIIKWIELSLIRKPSKKRVGELLEAVARHDEEGARDKVAAVRGPTGKMLRVGVDHIHEPREIIEESMYETILTTRLRVNRFLSFIAVSAAAAPLLGLLGTVTGIIDTFKMITVFGSGDVKMLSGGISEALITTKFGLIVAIPSLLLHAFLSRKAKGVISQMEKVAVSFVNQVNKTPFAPQAYGHHEWQRRGPRSSEPRHGARSGQGGLGRDAWPDGRQSTTPATFLGFHHGDLEQNPQSGHRAHRPSQRDLARGRLGNDRDRGHRDDDVWSGGKPLPSIARQEVHLDLRGKLATLDRSSGRTSRTHRQDPRFRHRRFHRR